MSLHSSAACPSPDGGAGAAAGRASCGADGQPPAAASTHSTPTPYLMADPFEAALGFAAAGTAPLVGVLGFTIWGKHWTGHPYMLNCFKGCVATIFFTLFFIVSSVIAPLAGWDASLDRFHHPVNLSSEASQPASVLPASGSMTQVILWLLFSSLLGIVIGDTCWLKAQQLLGTSSVVLIDAFKPWFSAFLGFVFLHEKPTWGWLGAVLTWLAVSWVEYNKSAAKEPAAEPDGTEMTGSFAASSARQRALRNGDELALNGSADSSAHEPVGRERFQEQVSAYTRKGWGYVWAFLNVLLDSLGLVITKKHGRALHAWEIAGVRFGGASVFMLLSVGAARLVAHLRPGAIARACGYVACGTPIARAGGAPQFYEWPVLDRRAIGWLVFAVFLTTFLASLLSNIALFKIDLFFVSTLGSLSPIWALLIGSCRCCRGLVGGREQATWRDWLGAILAIVGVVVLIWGSTAGQS